MARLFYNRLTPSGITATANISGYEPANVQQASVEREYRSYDVFGQKFINIDLGSLKRVAGVFLNGLNSTDPVLFYQHASVNNRAIGLFGYADENSRFRAIDYAGKTLLSQNIVIAISNFLDNALGELTHDLIVQNPSALSAFEYRAIQGPINYTVTSGNVLKYDVKRAGTNPDASAGGFEVDFTTSPFNGRGASLVDSGGNLCVYGPAGAANVWLNRSISLTPIVGKVLTNMYVVNESDASGQHLAYYRNIRIESSGGAILWQIYKGGRTAINSVTLSQFSSGKLTAQSEPADAANFWRVGNIDIFQDALDLPPFEWGYSVRTVEPFVGRALDNGLNPRYLSGPAYKIIKISVRRFRLEDWNPFFAALRTGRCVLDIDLPGLRAADKWPVKLESLDIERARSSPVLDTFSFELREVVA